MNLPSIEGRACIPVRLLPFLTAWLPLSPDVIAKLLSHRDPWRKWHSVSYNLTVDGTHHPVNPSEWDLISDDLTILEKCLKLPEKFEFQHYPEWRQRSIERLPAAVFVWRDDFEADYERTFGEQSYPSPRLGASEVSEEDAEAELNRIVELCHDGSKAAQKSLEEVFERAERDLVYRTGDGELSFNPILSSDERRLVLD